MESLICATYPIVNNYPLTDPFFTSPIQVLQTTRTPKSWKALISSIVEKDEADVNQNVEIGRFFLEKEVNNLLLQLKVLKSTRG